MALRGTLTHWKTRLLASQLSISPSHALGLLEALWNVTAEDAPRGNIGRLPNRAIAMQMFTDLDAEAVIAALVISGHLETHTDHRLIVHDWDQHCDDATNNRVARTGLNYANGAEPRLQRFSMKERAHISALRVQAGTEQQKYAHDVRSEAHDVQETAPESAGHAHDVRGTAHKSALPEPVPGPEPVPEPEKDQRLPSDKRSAATGERHAACKAQVHAYWHHRHPGEEHAPWDGSDAKALDRLLKAKPDLTPPRFRELLACRERSDVNHDERPRVWLERLTDYAGGPLDRFRLPTGPPGPRDGIRSVQPESPLPPRREGTPPPHPSQQEQARAGALRGPIASKRELTAEELDWLKDFDARLEAVRAWHQDPVAVPA